MLTKRFTQRCVKRLQNVLEMFYQNILAKYVDKTFPKRFVESTHMRLQNVLGINQDP